MREVVTKEEYEDYLGSVIYGSKFRYFVGCTLLYLFISIVLDLMTDSMSLVFTFEAIIGNIIISVIWGALFTAIFLPIMKMLSMNNTNVQIDVNRSNQYSLYLPCSYKKSTTNSIGGVLYLSKDKLLFKPHKMNLGSKEIVMEAQEVISISEEQQKVTFLAKFMFKNIPNCLVLDTGSSIIKFVVPDISRVMDVLAEEGLACID